jgi:hypothetical protein
MKGLSYGDHERLLFTCVFPASGGAFALSDISIEDHLRRPTTRIVDMRRNGRNNGISSYHTVDHYGNEFVTNVH